MTLCIGALAVVLAMALGAWLGRKTRTPLVVPDAVAPRTRELQASMDELRNVHAALSLDRKLHLAIWDSSPLPKWIFDLETLRFLDVNHAAIALYGYSHEEFLNLTLADIREPEEMPRFLAAVRAPDTGGRRPGLWSHRAKDGSIVEVEVTAHDLRVEGRSLVCSTMRDVTEARRVELRLAASEERYRKVFEASAMPMWIWDVDTFQFIATNDAASRLYGYSRDEFAAMTLEALLPESDHEGFRERAVEAITGDFLGERTHRTKSGSTVRVEIAAQRLVLDGRRCVLAVARDVTERRNLEAQLFQAQKMEAIGRLAGGIAHDFNNILAAVLADAEWMATELGQHHVLYPDAMGIATAAQRGAALTRQMLAFSRGEPRQPRQLRLNALISDTEKLLRRLLGEHVRLTCCLDPLLGVVEADPSQVEQVLLNLAINARDAMPSGGVMTIASRNVHFADGRHGLTAGEYVAVSVTDTGCGMDGATMGRIFEPFFTTKEVGKGTGLGLSTVFGIVQQSAGAIAVESQPGHGSTFTVYLPRCARASPTPAKPLEIRRAAASGKTVLVVEDDEHVRRVVCRVLRAEGYGVVETKSAAEASGVIGDPERRVHLVLTDIVMPGMDGVSFAEQVRIARAQLPVLLMSGYTEKVAALEGSCPLLAKPFTPAQLRSAVREALEAA